MLLKSHTVHPYFITHRGRQWLLLSLEENKTPPNAVEVSLHTDEAFLMEVRHDNLTHTCVKDSFHNQLVVCRAHSEHESGQGCGAWWRLEESLALCSTPQRDWPAMNGKDITSGKLLHCTFIYFQLSNYNS